MTLDLGLTRRLVKGQPLTAEENDDNLDKLEGGVGDSVQEGDSRLTDARTPTAHKTTHQTGGADALSPGDIGAEVAGAAAALAGTLAAVATSGEYGDLSGTPGVVTSSEAGLQKARGFGTITYAAQVTLDCAALDGQVNTITLTGNLEFLTSNLANGQELQIRLLPGAESRDLLFPADWVFYEDSKPTSIAANKRGTLSIRVHGTTNADVDAVYAEQR